MKLCTKCDCCDPRAAALALGRWCFGLLFFFFGLGKFAHLSGFATNLAQQFQSTWLPQLLVSLFGHVLPFWEVTVGALLIVGIFPTSTLFATGVLLLILVFGQVLLGNGAVIFNNTVYLLAVTALLFLQDYDTWVLFPRRARAPTPGSGTTG